MSAAEPDDCLTEPIGATDVATAGDLVSEAAWHGSARHLPRLDPWHSFSSCLWCIYDYIRQRQRTDLAGSTGSDRLTGFLALGVHSATSLVMIAVVAYTL